MRLNLLRSGIRDPADLVRHEKEWIRQCCMTIRKGPGLNEAKNISAELEMRIQQFAMWCRYRYLTQRPFDLNTATIANLGLVSDWINQLAKDQEASAVDKFSDSADKRVWFESMEAYFAGQKGAAGMPVLYVVRDEVALPAADPGFGMPDMDSEVQSRGRHNGHFWRADNRTVFTFLRLKCHGTTAWTTISRHDARKDGRAAWLALKNQHLGSDVRQVLLRKADKFLLNARFDGKSSKFTFDRFIARMRQAFQDMEPGDVMSEQRKAQEGNQAD